MKYIIVAKFLQDMTIQELLYEAVGDEQPSANLSSLRTPYDISSQGGSPLFVNSVFLVGIFCKRNCMSGAAA